MVRLFLIVEAAAFIVASLVHRGILTNGYEHARAATAESVLAAVLVVGLIVSWIVPAHLRTIGLIAEGFALLGTLVGLVMVVIGVGPQTTADLIYHLALIALLVRGLIVTKGAPASGAVTGGPYISGR